MGKDLIYSYKCILSDLFPIDFSVRGAVRLPCARSFHNHRLCHLCGLGSPCRGQGHGAATGARSASNASGRAKRRPSPVGSQSWRVFWEVFMGFLLGVFGVFICFYGDLIWDVSWSFFMVSFLCDSLKGISWGNIFGPRLTPEWYLMILDTGGALKLCLLVYEPY